jgi:hypothetical protein
MKIVWTRIDNPTETFIIVTEVLSKVGSVFVLLCLFRTLSYWVRMKCYPGQIVPPLMDRIMRLVTLIALIGQILGIVGVVKMMNETDYNTGVTLRDASRALLLLASVVFILLVLMNSARANDSTNAFILIILGVISVIRSAYDVVAIIVPSTSVIATNEIVQLCFDSIPEALAIGICIFYNLSRVTSTYMVRILRVKYCTVYNIINENFLLAKRPHQNGRHLRTGRAVQLSSSAQCRPIPIIISTI